MKKIAVIIAACLLLALSLALAACQGGKAGNEEKISQAENAAPETETPNSGSDSSGNAADLLAETEDVVEIKERLFLAGINDIYLNQNDYLGDTIKYEGMFTSYFYQDAGMTYYLVYRNSPGCCGADGQAGFEVLWPDGVDNPYPNENDWVEAVGTLESYDEGGSSYLRLRLDSLTAKTERGAEFVSQ